MIDEQRARIDALEEHLAHQDLLLSELNDVVTRQQGEIEALTARLRRFLDRVESLESQAPAPHNAPPPHY
ncbi:SlyX family protein [Maricaulis sp. CAU 1757]